MISTQFLQKRSDWWHVKNENLKFCLFFFLLLTVRNDVKGQFDEEFQVMVVRNQTGQKKLSSHTQTHCIILLKIVGIIILLGIICMYYNFSWNSKFLVFYREQCSHGLRFTLLTYDYSSELVIFVYHNHSLWFFQKIHFDVIVCIGHYWIM